jgi:hypothetical protein
MKNRNGITWGKGEDFGFGAKWVAICEDHSQLAEDTSKARIRTLSAMDFCECHMGTCRSSAYTSAPCADCGAVSEAC